LKGLITGYPDDLRRYAPLTVNTALTICNPLFRAAWEWKKVFYSFGWSWHKGTRCRISKR